MSLPDLSRRQALASVSAIPALSLPGCATIAGAGSRTLDETSAAALIDRAQRTTTVALGSPLNSQAVTLV